MQFQGNASLIQYKTFWKAGYKKLRELYLLKPTQLEYNEACIEKASTESLGFTSFKLNYTASCTTSN